MFLNIYTYLVGFQKANFMESNEDDFNCLFCFKDIISETYFSSLIVDIDRSLLHYERFKCKDWEFHLDDLI